jgi:small subunit ribosomal protein S18
MARDRRRNAAADRRRVPKKKTSILTTENISYVDYKDVNLLRRFMSERAKIRARRVTGNSQQQQVAVAKAIRVAREMALLPYSVRQVTQRSKGGGRRDRGERDDRSLAGPDGDDTERTDAGRGDRHGSGVDGDVGFDDVASAAADDSSDDLSDDLNDDINNDLNGDINDGGGDDE